MKPLLQDLLAQPGRVLGTWTQFSDAQLLDLVGAAGFHFSIIDLEHGPFGIDTAAGLIRDAEAARLVPLVRVPRGEHRLAARLLDCGAAGVVAPGVDSAAEAQAWTRALQFAPAGERGACPIVRAAAHSLQDWASTEAQQARAGLVVLIESPAGVQACEAICAVPGVMAVMAGPFDLSVALGLHGQASHSPVQVACRKVQAAAQAQGKAFVMPVFAAEPLLMQQQLQNWAALGVRHFVVGADKIIVAHALRQYAQAAAG
jgi:4-hydroxy-2-oxoheptanedioate aldolase